MARARMARVSFYRDAKGEWRWSFKAPNGRVIADCAEGYRTYAGCRKGFTALVDYLQVEPIGQEVE